MILDLEGFFIQGHFHTREMGWCSVHTPHRYGSYHYAPTLAFHTLATKDKTTVHYVQRHIHGLSYYPPADQAKSVSSLETDLQALYNQFMAPDCPYVAYKGGTVEKTLLDRLNIPCWNLELLGCPKFEQLSRLKTVSSCGQHRHVFKHHCPVVETYHFVQWLRCQLSLPYDTAYVNWNSVTRVQ